MMRNTPIMFWRHHALKRGHIRPSAADVIEWLLMVAGPAGAFVAFGWWWCAVLALAAARFLIPQWGVPTDLRWEE